MAIVVLVAIHFKGNNMIHVNEDKNDMKAIEQFIADYNDGDSEMNLPHSVMSLDKPVLLYIISRLMVE